MMLTRVVRRCTPAASGMLARTRGHWCRARGSRRSGWGGRLVLLVVGQVVAQRPQLRAQEVTGGDLANRRPQRSDLAGQELHVGVSAGVGLAVLLGDDLVARLL